MKKIGKLKLNEMEKRELKRREMNNIHGGDDLCWCACGVGLNSADVVDDSTDYKGPGCGCACWCSGDSTFGTIVNAGSLDEHGIWY